MRVPCLPPLRRFLSAAAVVAGCLPLPAQAQPGQAYPMGSQFGYASFGPGPSLQVNCVPYPLGPGLRVQSTQHLLVLRGQLPGLSGPAVFLRDAMGNVFEVWMLAPGQVPAGVAQAANQCLFRHF